MAPLPLPLSFSLPLEVGPLKSSWWIWGTSCAPRSILRFWGRSVEGGPSGGGLNIFWGEGTHFRE